MSIQHCDKCDKYIDTDLNAEHFGDDVNGCEDTFECTMDDKCPCEDCRAENWAGQK